MERDQVLAEVFAAAAAMEPALSEDEVALDAARIVAKNAFVPMPVDPRSAAG